MLREFAAPFRPLVLPTMPAPCVVGACRSVARAAAMLLYCAALAGCGIKGPLRPPPPPPAAAPADAGTAPAPAAAPAQSDPTEKPKSP